MKIKLLIVLLLLCAACSHKYHIEVVKNLNCNEHNSDIAAQRAPGKLIKKNAKDQLQSLKFKFDIIGYDENGRSVETINETPVVAMPIDNGWLLGSDRGEWGGALVYKSHDVKQQEIIRDNIKDIFKYPYGYIIITGLDHLSLRYGAIYLITYKNKKFCSKKLHNLVASPTSWWFLDTGELLINHYEQESTVFTPNGEIYRASCKKD